MSILLVGLNHRTAPVELREQLALSGHELTLALGELPLHAAVFNGDPALGLQDAPPALREGVILSTCNRLEVYATARQIAGGRAAIENFLSRLYGIPIGVLKPYLYFMHDQDAVRHLMRVAAGLDSMILGEPQILGQVSQAFASAKAASTTGPVLSHLFMQAIHAGKRARTETDISRYTTSVSHAAALFAGDKVGDLGAVDVLVIGAGEMAQLAAQALQRHGARRIACINRTYSGAQALAEAVGGQAVAWRHLTAALRQADVVISATGAPHTVVHADDVATALSGREDRPLVLIDIAVPRDIEEAVGNLPNVYRYDIDDLQATLDENLARREAAVPQVEAIIAEEAAGFAEWMGSRQIIPVITELRRWAAGVAEAEVERALSRLGDPGPREREVIEALARRLVNKLLHRPTVYLKGQAADGRGYLYASAVRELFALGEPEDQPEGTRDGDRSGGDHAESIPEFERITAGD
ncbi:MAG TPA: glutamyl-tRNA reductase [Chloroflexi bacterium]|nr:glutamyl-tRNA reductase [Chloroflexota bacterium]